MPGHWLSRKDFEALVAEAVKGLPKEFQRYLDNVAIEVQEEPTEEALEAVGLEQEDADELLGLYWGRSIQSESFFDTGGQLPDRVYIYRGPILRQCQTEADVVCEVQETVAHEIGHHFGLSDDDMPF
jgi:predicted Zn-dependent protease with MMP-like domain